MSFGTTLVFNGTTSGWSNTQTITIPETNTTSTIPTQSLSPSPSPTLTVSPIITPSPSQTQQSSSGPAPPIPFRIDVQTVTNDSASPSVFPMLTLHQGETETLRINLTPQETNNNVSLRLWFYGIAPNFDSWTNTWDTKNMSLPPGITSSLNPSTLLLSDNTTQTATLTLTVAPNARTGDFKVMVDAWFAPSDNSSPTMSTDRAFVLEIAQSPATTLNLNIAIYGAAALIAVVILFTLSIYFRKHHRKST